MTIARTVDCLRPIDTVADIDPGTFVRHYSNPRRPLVVRDLATQWPAYEKWSLEIMRERFGASPMPLHRTGPLDPRAPFQCTPG